MPYVAVVHFLEGIEFVIVSSAIGINFWISIAFEYSAHYPFTILESAISKNQTWFFTVHAMLITFFAKWAYGSCKFPMYRQYAITSIQNNQLTMHLTFRIQTITEPIKAILDFSVPRIVFLIIDFVNILYRIKGKVNTKSYWDRWRWLKSWINVWFWSST